MYVVIVVTKLETIHVNGVLFIISLEVERNIEKIVDCINSVIEVHDISLYTSDTSL